MNYVEKKEGNIFCIPLFLPNIITKPNKSYTRNKFDPSKKYAFGRIVECDPHDESLYIVEIFQYIGKIPDNKEIIINSKLICDPIFVIEPFIIKRWRFIFEDKNYDKYKDSDYSNIKFFAVPYEEPLLWKGGKDIGYLSVKESQSLGSIRFFTPGDVEEVLRDIIEGKQVSFYLEFTEHNLQGSGKPLKIHM